MKLRVKLVVAITAITALGTGVAIAATSPTVATGPATAVTQTTAVLHGTVNPGGNQTGYLFDYGPTANFGLTTKSRSVGNGTRSVPVAVRIRGLTPGTTYFYRVAALNRSGAANGAPASFKTAGIPPASVTTGPSVGVGKYQATPTGSVNPQGAANTFWKIQYGLSDAYGLETFPLPLAALNSSLPVSATILGLAPGKLFHYRIVASNNSGVTDGADQTFFTFPSFRRTPKMRSRTSPSRLTRRPYTFTTSGSLYGAAYFVPEPLRCTGNVGIRAYKGGRQVAYVLTQVEPDCSFSTPVPFGHLLGGPSALAVKVFYRGNGYLKSVQRIDHVTLG